MQSKLLKILASDGLILNFGGGRHRGGRNFTGGGPLAPHGTALGCDHSIRVTASPTIVQTLHADEILLT